MPTRERYLSDPEYVRQCQRAFGAEPETPYFELFIPRQHLTGEIAMAVQRPIWELENTVIWPQMAALLQADGIRGDLLEFGVYGGGSLRRHIQIFRPTGVVERFYGFDSFKGLPALDQAKDLKGRWHEGQFSDTSKEGVQRMLEESVGHTDDVELVEGWFNETLPLYADRIRQVAFVRVDCDLYQSTVDVFAFLAGRLVDGAVLYFDDWTHDAATGETRAFFEFADRERARYTFERLLTVSDGALAVRVRHVR
ncbi:MAG: TylF/MycF/NovP-related O-methyltransferase [Vicinamibacterales bacterium]